MELVAYLFLFLGICAGVSSITLYFKSKKTPTDSYESDKQQHYKSNANINFGFCVVLLFSAFLFFLGSKRLITDNCVPPASQTKTRTDFF